MLRRLSILVLLAHLLLLQMLAPIAHCHGEAQARPHVHLDCLGLLGHDHSHSDDQPDSDHDDDAVYLPDDPASLTTTSRIVGDESSHWLAVLIRPESFASDSGRAPIGRSLLFSEAVGFPVSLRAFALRI